MLRWAISYLEAEEVTLEYKTLDAQNNLLAK